MIGETKVCAVTQTELIYRGYEIADLAEKATFEGVSHLVLVGHKPTDAELEAAVTNICRCGTFQEVRKAINAVVKA